MFFHSSCAITSTLFVLLCQKKLQCCFDSFHIIASILLGLLFHSSRAITFTLLMLLLLLFYSRCSLFFLCCCLYFIHVVVVYILFVLLFCSSCVLSTYWPIKMLFFSRCCALVSFVNMVLPLPSLPCVGHKLELARPIFSILRQHKMNEKTQKPKKCSIF